MGADRVTPELVAKLRKLDAIAKARGQNLAQLALAWLLKDERVTSVLIGADGRIRTVHAGFRDDDRAPLEAALREALAARAA